MYKKTRKSDELDLTRRNLLRRSADFVPACVGPGVGQILRIVRVPACTSFGVFPRRSQLCLCRFSEVL